MEDFVEMLLSFPLDPSPDVVEIIAESVYANSSTMDGRRFAADFVAKRKMDAQGGGATDASAWGFAMNAIRGGGGGAAQRATSPPTVKAPAPRAAFGFAGGSPEAMWMPGGDEAFRNMSRGPAADERAVPRQAQSQFATWMPPGAQAETKGPAAPEARREMMTDLAFQELYDVASPEEESEPTELLNAMSMYTKAAVANKGKKKGGRR